MAVWRRARDCHPMRVTVSVDPSELKPRTGASYGTSPSAPEPTSPSDDLRQGPSPLRCDARAVDGESQDPSPGSGPLAGGRAVEAWPAGERLRQGLTTACQTALRTLWSSSTTHLPECRLIRRATISQEPSHEDIVTCGTRLVGPA